jgi:hypothetical protein
VLKTRAQIGFYVGGNRLFFLSVNACFFGVNIAFDVLPPDPNLGKLPPIF